jgi:hypothetical protein
MNQFEHRVPKQVWILAVVEAPRHFVKVGRQMFCRHTMPCSHNPALRSCEATSECPAFAIAAPLAAPSASGETRHIGIHWQGKGVVHDKRDGANES